MRKISGAARTLARRYAEALGQLAQAADQLDQVEKDLQAVQNLVDEVPAFAGMLNNPRLNSRIKNQMLEESLDGQVSRLVIGFLKLLVVKRREEILPAIVSEFEKIADQARGVLRAEVISAHALSAEQTVALQTRLEKMVGKPVKLVLQVDPGLIGGLKIRMNDVVIDGSIDRRLKLLHKHMTADANKRQEQEGIGAQG
ncbi:MAG TPA: ATP synthase F1 subunit delta [Firmicutes bacterium]|nr:ATP synthase F1 subunit delta [Bacillota bacterium]